MKTKVILWLAGMVLFFLVCTVVAHAQRSVLAAVNDTVNITPGIPVTLNVLANDTIPAGDAVGIIVSGGSSFLTGTIGTGGEVTYVLDHWGYSGYIFKNYQIRDSTLGVTSAAARVVFRVHDRSFGYLDINNVRARFNSSGLHFFHDTAQYEVPKGSGKTSLFSNSLWIGGYDAGNDLHFAGEQYRQGPGSNVSWRYQDFRAGPVSDSAAYNIYQDTIWNYTWKVNRSEIEYHRNHFWEQGYVPVYNILTWPGNGNTALGQAHRLAPFSDRNGNGVYEPYDGDYPEIRGDQALFFIYNDDHGEHKESLGEKLKVEIHGMAYAFDRPNDTAFKNTTFLHCKVINRSQNTYTGTLFGIFTDIDLGNWTDDYIGCDPERGMYYGYNGDSTDGSGQSNTYGANPPAQAVVILGGPAMDADGYDNPSFKGTNIAGPSFMGSCNIVSLDSTVVSMKYGPGEVNEAPFLVRPEAINGLNFGDGITDNERHGMSRFIGLIDNTPGVPTYGDKYPAFDDQYYNIMLGRMKDTTRMIYGGNGHLLAGGFGPECDFMFPGLSDACDWGTSGQPPNGPKEWNEKAAQNSSGDRKGTGSSGPFTFGPGEVQEVDIAFAWARDYNHYDSTLAKLNAVVDTIRRHFRDNMAPGGGMFYALNDQIKDHGSRLKIYPNPAKDRINVEIPCLTPEKYEITLLTAPGKVIYSKTIWQTPVYQLDATNIPSGFYLVKVKAGNTVLMSKVIILK